MSKALIETYINRFYGYGSWDFDLWFVGMEEGGVSSAEEFLNRLEIWKNRGCRDLEDARSYHEAIGLTQWFGKGATL